MEIEKERPITTEPEHPAPPFIGEDPALDFLNSIAAPKGSEIEWIGDGYDLLVWLVLAGLIPAVLAARFREKATQADLDAVAAEAREMRNWLRAFVRAHGGRPLQATALGDLGALNRLLAKDSSFRQLEAHKGPRLDEASRGSNLRWRCDRRWRSPESLLLPLAEAMGDLVSTADFRNLRNCEGPTCTMWFHDVSQNHTRRWCSMAVCGNRAKAAAHRARQRASSARP